jgi:hypothetical protein
MITAMVPILLFLFIFFKWYQDRSDFRQFKSQFLQRQNTVMAYDAMEVSTGFGDLLEKAGRDVQILELIAPTAEAYNRFYLAQMGTYTRYDQDDTVTNAPLPFYNRLSFLNLKGDLIFEVNDGKADHPNRPLAKCSLRDLCDRSFIEAALKLSVGEIYYGKLLRYYTPEGVPEDYSGAGLSVAYRGNKGIFIASIDYRHLRDHLSSPAFPYDPKRNLLNAYQKGNYIYIVDRDNNFITHPHYWKCIGIDRKTGQWVTPMKEDSESGTHPINVAAYQKGVLKDYFDRLLKTSFVNKGVDIFQAPNLAGTSRVLSVAPIFISKGQFTNDDVFGHVVIGCNVDYFEEPKTMIVPYY